VEGLADTLVAFHAPPTYLEQYHAVLGLAAISDDPDVGPSCRAFRGRARVGCGRAGGTKARRPCPCGRSNGRPEDQNMLMDVASGEAIALVDLDTVKPAWCNYDIGDCLRFLLQTRWGGNKADWAPCALTPKFV